MVRASIAVLALLLAACPGSSDKTNNNPPPPLPGDDAAPAEPEAALTAEEAAVVDRLTDMTIDLATKMQGAGDDCAKLTEVVNAWADANGAEQAKLYQEMEKIPEAKLKLAAERASARTEQSKSVFAGMKDRVETCAQNDPKFAEAFGRIGG